MTGGLKKCLGFLFVLILAFSVLACSSSGNAGNPDDPNKPGPVDPSAPPKKGENPLAIATALPDISVAEDLDQFIDDVNTPGGHNNDPLAVGVIISPYFSLKIDDDIVPVYSVRTAFGIHSFSQYDVNDDAFPLSVELSFTTDKSSIIVLPEIAEVEAKLENGVVTCMLTERGSFSFVFDESRDEPFTLLVREIEAFSAPEDYDVIELEPGTHSREVMFTAAKQVLYFKAGLHYVHRIEFLDDTMVYLERGALLRAIMPNAEDETPTNPSDWAGKTVWRNFFYAANRKNISITGRGFVDFTALDWHARGPLSFNGCDNVQIDGVIFNNSVTWNMVIASCRNIDIRNVAMFGYRQNNDGIALVDSADALVEDCFGRLGDDIFEVKSTNGSSTVDIDNITFSRCDAWPDKARGLGIIHETVRDVTNVKFVDCSVGFASANWGDALGALVVIMAHASTVSDIVFENIEIYSNILYPINVTLHPESDGTIDNIYFNNIRWNGANPVRIVNNSKGTGEIGNLWFDNIYINGKWVYRTIGSTALPLSLSGVDKSIVKLNKNESIQD